MHNIHYTQQAASHAAQYNHAQHTLYTTGCITDYTTGYIIGCITGCSTGDIFRESQSIAR